jgi:hypothetical protein
VYQQVFSLLAAKSSHAAQSGGAADMTLNDRI